MMKSIIALTLASMALASPVPEPAAAAAPPAFKIKNVVSGGSGCPQGSIDINFSDSAILPIYFSRDFTATVGPYTAADQSRKNCQINLQLQYSPGWSYAVYSADYAGWADLDAGVKGIVKSTYYFSGQTEQVRSADYFFARSMVTNIGAGFVHCAPFRARVGLVQQARRDRAVHLVPVQRRVALQRQRRGGAYPLGDCEQRHHCRYQGELEIHQLALHQVATVLDARKGVGL